MTYLREANRLLGLDPLDWLILLTGSTLSGAIVLLMSSHSPRATFRSQMQSRQIAKIGLASQAEGGAALAPTSAFPFAPTLCSVHSFTGAWMRFLGSIPAAGAASSAASAAHGVGMPGLGGITSMFSGRRVGSNVLNDRKGRPRLSSVT